IQNIAARSGKYEYTRLNGHTMRLHPSSVWFKFMPDIIVCTVILEINGRRLAIDVQAVEPAWIEEIAPEMIKVRKEPLHHTFKGGVVGTYIVTYLNGVEVSRVFSRGNKGELLSLEQLEAEQRQ